MNLAERTFDGYRIYAAALEIPGSSGFHGAVVVMTSWSESRTRTEIFRDECLEDGRVWLDRQEALAFALQVGQSAIFAQRVLNEHQALEHAKTALAGDVAIIMANVRAMG